MQFELKFHIRSPIKSVRDTAHRNTLAARGEKPPMSESPIVIISGEELVRNAVRSSLVTSLTRNLSDSPSFFEH